MNVFGAVTRPIGILAHFYSLYQVGNAVLNYTILLIATEKIK